MKKFKSKCGYVVYKTTTIECIKTTDGFGICDECGKTDNTLYLVPVLNHAQCPKCFNQWNEESEFYEEDLWFEKGYENAWEKRAKEKNIEIIKLEEEDYGR